MVRRSRRSLLPSLDRRRNAESCKAGSNIEGFHVRPVSSCVIRQLTAAGCGAVLSPGSRRVRRPCLRAFDRPRIRVVQEGCRRSAGRPAASSRYGHRWRMVSASCGAARARRSHLVLLSEWSPAPAWPAACPRPLGRDVSMRRSRRRGGGGAGVGAARGQPLPLKPRVLWATAVSGRSMRVPGKHANKQTIGKGGQAAFPRCCPCSGPSRRSARLFASLAPFSVHWCGWATGGKGIWGDWRVTATAPPTTEGTPP